MNTCEGAFSEAASRASAIFEGPLRGTRKAENSFAVPSRKGVASFFVPRCGPLEGSDRGRVRREGPLERPFERCASFTRAFEGPLNSANSFTPPCRRYLQGHEWRRTPPRRYLRDHFFVRETLTEADCDGLDRHDHPERGSARRSGSFAEASDEPRQRFGASEWALRWHLSTVQLVREGHLMGMSRPLAGSEALRWGNWRQRHRPEGPLVGLP